MNYLIYLHSIGIEHKKLNIIFNDNSNYKDFFEKLSQFNLKNFYKEDKIKQILENKSKLNIKKIDKIVKDLHIKIIKKSDKKYPKLLLHIQNPPYFLYVRGEIDCNDNFFSVVGSRKMSIYSQKAGEKIIPDLTKFFTIVSGGAGGCDTLSHKIALKNNKKTIAVFGTGIDICYPSGNKLLFEEIIKKGGALISIFPLFTKGTKYTFPIRNEIVAGISRGVLILEAGEKSGTLITANLSLEQGKDLFVIPGDIFLFNYIGCNNLIKKGYAKLVTCSEDILLEYNYEIEIKEKSIPFSNNIQKIIYEYLQTNTSQSIDDILENTNIDYNELILNLTLMELSSLIKKDIFGKYDI